MTRPAPSPGVHAWDVFLSYSRRDFDAVLEIQRQLAARGLRTFVDQQLVAGLPWPSALSEALTSSRAVAVFLGSGELGPWQQRERAFALDRQASLEARGERYLVIPVLLPGAQLAPDFLLQNTWIDLRHAAQVPEALDRLAAAIRNGEDDRETANVPALDLCPYRGLQTFTEADAALYFGRTRDVETLRQKVQHSELNLVAVMGASGNGKSSLVAAGLLPWLRRQRPPQPTWDVAWMTPGDHPWRRLAEGLMDLLTPEASDADKIAGAGTIAKECAAGDGAFQSVVYRILARSNGTDRLLLVIDQFEELLTLAPEAMRQPFVETLLASPALPVTIVLTLRADFFKAATSISVTLNDRLSKGFVILGPSYEQDLRDSIEKPAALVGLTFESGLVDRIVADVVGKPGRLPLLEYALTELWKSRAGGRLTFSAYQAAGGVANAIATRAEYVFGTLTEDEQKIAARLFTRLVRVGTGEEERVDMRYRAPRHEVGEAAWAVAQRFTHSQVRLLITSTNGSSHEEEVEVCHEALIQGWTRLRDWIAADREFLVWRQELGYELAKWEATGRNEAAMLRGVLLKRARTWLATRPDDFSAAERHYILWTAADTYQIERLIADASEVKKFFDDAVLVNWLIVHRFASGAQEFADEDVRRAGDELHQRFARICLRTGDHARALASAREIADHGRRADSLIEVLRSWETGADDVSADDLIREASANVGRESRSASVTLSALGVVAAERGFTEAFFALPELLSHGHGVFVRVVEKLIELGHTDAARRFARDSVAFSFSTQALTAAAVALNDADLAREAFDVACAGSYPNVLEPLKAVVETAGGDAALDLFPRITGANDRLRALRIVIDTVKSPDAPLGRRLRLAALALVGESSERAALRYPIEHVIKAFCGAGMPAAGFEIARQLEPDMQPHALLCAAREVALRGDEEQAAVVALEALSAEIADGKRFYMWEWTLKEFVPHVVELATSERLVSAAFAIADPAKCAAFLTALAAILDAGDPQMSRVCQGAWEAASRIQRQDEKSRAIRDLIGVMFKRGMEFDAFEDIAGENADGFVGLLELFHILLEAGRDDEASRVLSRATMLESKIERDGSDFDLCLAAARLGEMSVAVAVVRKPGALYAAANTLAREGEFRVAVALCQAFMDRAKRTANEHEGTIGLWDAIVKVAIERGDLELALELARPALRGAPGESPSSPVIEALVRADELPFLRSCIDQVRSVDGRCLALAETSRLLSIAGRRGQSLGFSQAAAALCTTVKQLPSRFLLAPVVSALIAAGAVEELRSLLLQIAAWVAAQQSIDGTRGSVPALAARDKSLQSAVTTILAASSDYAKAGIYPIVMEACAALGEGELAKALSHDLADINGRVKALASAARVASGDATERLSAAVVREARSITNPAGRAAMLVAILDAIRSVDIAADVIKEVGVITASSLEPTIGKLPELLRRFDDVAERRTIANAASHAVRAHELSENRKFPIRRLIEALATVNLLEESRAIAREEADPKERAWLLVALMKDAHQASEAERLSLVQEALNVVHELTEWNDRMAPGLGIVETMQTLPPASLVALGKRIGEGMLKAEYLVMSIEAIGARDLQAATDACRTALSMAVQQEEYGWRKHFVHSATFKLSIAGAVSHAVECARSLNGQDRVVGTGAALHGAIARLELHPQEWEVTGRAIVDVFEREASWSRRDLIESTAAALRTRPLREQMVTFASSVTSMEVRADLLVAVIKASVAFSGDLRGASVQAHAAIETATMIDGDRERHERLTDVLLVFTQADGARLETLASAIATESDRARVLAVVARDLAWSGRAAQALAVAESITDPESRAEALTNLVAFWCEMGPMKRAEKAATEALRATQQIPGADVRQAPIRKLLEVVWTHGMESLATRLPDLVGGSERRAEVLFIIVQQLAGRGRFEEAQTIMQRIPESRHTVALCISMATAYIDAGRLEEAVAMIDRASSAGRNEEVALYKIVTMYIDRQAYDAAVATAARIRDQPEPPFGNVDKWDTFTHIVDGMLASGDIDGALRVACAIEADGARVAAMTQVAAVAFSRQAVEIGEQALAEAQTVRGRIRDPEVYAYAAARIAVVLASRGQYEFARLTVEGISQRERLWAYTGILRHYVATERPELAVALADVCEAPLDAGA